MLESNIAGIVDHFISWLFYSCWRSKCCVLVLLPRVGACGGTAVIYFRRSRYLFSVRVRKSTSNDARNFTQQVMHRTTISIYLTNTVLLVVSFIAHLYYLPLTYLLYYVSVTKTVFLPGAVTLLDTTTNNNGGTRL